MNNFQGENIDLPVPSKIEEAQGGNWTLYHAQMGALDALRPVKE